MIAHDKDLAYAEIANRIEKGSYKPTAPYPHPSQGGMSDHALKRLQWTHENRELRRKFMEDCITTFDVRRSDIEERLAKKAMDIAWANGRGGGLMEVLDHFYELQELICREHRNRLEAV